MSDTTRRGFMAGVAALLAGCSSREEEEETPPPPTPKQRYPGGADDRPTVEPADTPTPGEDTETPGDTPTETPEETETPTEKPEGGRVTAYRIDNDVFDILEGGQRDLRDAADDLNNLMDDLEEDPVYPRGDNGKDIFYRSLNKILGSVLNLGSTEPFEKGVTFEDVLWRRRGGRDSVRVDGEKYVFSDDVQRFGRSLDLDDFVEDLLEDGDEDRDYIEDIVSDYEDLHVALDEDPEFSESRMKRQLRMLRDRFLDDFNDRAQDIYDEINRLEDEYGFDDLEFISRYLEDSIDRVRVSRDEIRNNRRIVSERSRDRIEEELRNIRKGYNETRRESAETLAETGLFGELAGYSVDSLGDLYDEAREDTPTDTPEDTPEPTPEPEDLPDTVELEFNSDEDRDEVENLWEAIDGGNYDDEDAADWVDEKVFERISNDTGVPKSELVEGDFDSDTPEKFDNDFISSIDAFKRDGEYRVRANIKEYPESTNDVYEVDGAVPDYVIKFLDDFDQY